MFRIPNTTLLFVDISTLARSSALYHFRRYTKSAWSFIKMQKKLIDDVTKIS